MAHLGLLTSILQYADPDLDVLLAALRAQGVEVDAPVWHDETVDWAGYDLVVIRSPWDYVERYDEFMAWLDRTGEVTRILNEPATVRWNIDKRYLDDLSALGVPCVPTTFCTSVREAEAAITAVAEGRVVVKPSVSAGSRDTGLFDPGDAKAVELARRIVGNGRTVMVQPAVERVIQSGEHGLFFFNGEYSHAFHKGPLLAPGGEYVGGEVQHDAITRGNPAPAEIALGTRAVAAVAEHGLGLPLYARVDVVPGDAPQLIELELFEPALWTSRVPEAVEAFVKAVRQQLEKP